MSPEEYWEFIEKIPLRPERDSSDGEAVICRAQDGSPVRVTKPEYLSDEERTSVAQSYEMWYAPRMN